MPEVVERAVGRYLRLTDRLLPGRVTGFYVVGSTALGSFRPQRSDIDFVAVVDRRLGAGELRRLWTVHALCATRSGLRAVSRVELAFPGVCNGVFVLADDLTTPVSQITPVAEHTARGFRVGRGSAANPVTWTILAEQGLTVRGPPPGRLGLQPQPELLRSWSLANVDSYWYSWGQRISSVVGATRPRWLIAWGVLGASRAHCTIATGEIVSKEEAGVYALETFGAEWHPLIEDALAYWQGRQRVDEAYYSWGLYNSTGATRRAGRFVQHVVDSAHTL
jgi:aminoglycoside adenylyltransferase-like protein/nucleotidyltransferase-like protein